MRAILQKRNEAQLWVGARSPASGWTPKLVFVLLGVGHIQGAAIQADQSPRSIPRPSRLLRSDRYNDLSAVQLRVSTDTYSDFLTNVQVESGNPFLVRAAVGSLRSWRFAKRMSRIFELTYNYQIVDFKIDFLKEPGLIDIGAPPSYSYVTCLSVGLLYPSRGIWQAELTSPGGNTSATLFINSNDCEISPERRFIFTTPYALGLPGIPSIVLKRFQLSSPRFGRPMILSNVRAPRSPEVCPRPYAAPGREAHPACRLSCPV